MLNTGGAKIIGDDVLEAIGVHCGVISWVEGFEQWEGHGSWEYWRRVSKELLTADEKLGSRDDSSILSSLRSAETAFARCTRYTFTGQPYLNAGERSNWLRTKD